MGYRRVQATGRGSYIISLPKRWVEENEIGKGGELAFKLLDDSSLVLVPRKIMEGKKEKEKPMLKEYTIIVDFKDDPQSVCRKLVSLYVISADLIHVRFKDGGINPKLKAAINNLVKNGLLGSEIIDETENEIAIQTLIDHPDFPLEKAIRRMAILALSADSGAMRALKDANQELIREVIETCNDVNRLNLYVVRQLKFSLEQNLFKELGFKTPKEFLGYRIVANDIKSIAENAMNVVSNIMVLKKMIDEETLFLRETVDEEVYSQISSFNASAHQLFEESLRAMFKRDYDHADKIISRLEALTAIESDLISIVSTKKVDPKVSSLLRLALDNSRRIIEYSRDVADVTLNRTIEEIATQNF